MSSRREPTVAPQALLLGNAVEVTESLAIGPLPPRGRTGGGELNKVAATNFAHPHPTLPPWGEGAGKSSVEPKSTALPPTSPFDDPECAYLAMPRGMHTFRQPSLYGREQADGAAGRTLLAEIARQLGSGRPENRWDLRGLDAASRRFVGEVLGRGEIGIRVAAPAERLEMEESVFAGLWQIRHIQGDGTQVDYLETGPLPFAVYEWAGRLTQGAHLAVPAEFPAGVMNAPAVLVEIADKSHNYRPGLDSVINLSLLPMTPEDVGLVAEVLGLAGLSLVSKGYGDCRIHLTRVPHVWWVQYFNAPGQLILNTLEVTAMPSVALAAAEDLADSAQRLAETLAELGA